MYQSPPTPRVAFADCGPAVLERMSSRSAEALPFCASTTSLMYGTLALDPAVMLPGWPPVITAPTTKSPAATAAVGPALTAVP